MDLVRRFQKIRRYQLTRLSQKPLYRVGHLKFGIWIIGYKKNLWIFFQNYGFIRKIEPFHLRMKNIIQMTATAGLTVPHSMKPIFQYIFDYLGFIPMNGNFDFVFEGLNRLWMVTLRKEIWLNQIKLLVWTTFFDLKKWFV